MTFVSHPIFLIFLTFFFFLLAKILQNKTGFFLLNPILLTIFALIAFLQCFDIEYSTYEKAGDFIAFWLQPAVVAFPGVTHLPQWGLVIECTPAETVENTEKTSTLK